MNMNKTLNIFIAFVAIIIIGFFMIGYSSSVQAPTNQTALNQYNNLTNATEISAAGIEGTLLLLIIAMVFVAIGTVFVMGRKH